MEKKALPPLTSFACLEVPRKRKKPETDHIDEMFNRLEAEDAFKPKRTKTAESDAKQIPAKPTEKLEDPPAKNPEWFRKTGNLVVKVGLQFLINLDTRGARKRLLRAVPKGHEEDQQENMASS